MGGLRSRSRCARRRHNADQEAAATRRLFKETDLIEGTVRPQIQANLICYARGVIALDWPAMRGGGSSVEVDETAALLDDQLKVVHTSGADRDRRGSDPDLVSLAPVPDEKGSIKPTAMERTLNELETDPAFSRESSLPFGCDADGRPLASTVS